MRIDTDERQTTLDDLIEAFEAAHAKCDQVELIDFLPAADHPLYLDARRELLRVDMELSWLDGRRHRFEDYARQFPDLYDDRATVQEVAFEEFRLRTLAGEAPSAAEYAELHGVDTTGWATSKTQAEEANARTDPGADVALLLNIAHTLGHDDSWTGSRHGDAAQALLRQNVHQSNSEAAFLLAQAMAALPQVGSAFLDFHLMAELGHGSFGRVYLARQGDLANRLVALKITVDLLGEEQKLAQLQHTHVVPIYSVHQAGPFQAVCMPYFGATTLADLIRAMQCQPSLPTSGKDLVRTVRSRQATLQATVSGAAPQRSATLTMLEESSHVHAVLAIAEAVTEGLIHAHEHGILHRDLKPANILLTDEGRPMLVDFNLSADVKLHTGLNELQRGGTLPYMAPESLESMRGAGPTTDARSDLYALGVVLFELLTGRLPFETRTGPLSEILPPMIAERLQAPPRLRRWNADVTPAVESIVRHCLQPDPSQRYQSALDLHEDLQRQRHHRPLRYAPEPSIRERAQKWVRRHPRLTSPSSLGGIAIVLVLCYMAPFAWQPLQQLMERVRKADDESNVAQEKINAAVGTARTTQAQIDALVQFREFEKSSASPRSILEIVSVMQMLPESWPYEDKRLGEAVADCRRTLQIYHVVEDAAWQLQPAVRDLPAPEQDKVRRKIAELLCAVVHAEQASLARVHDQTQQCAFAIAASTLPGAGREIWGAGEAAIRARILAAATWNERARACFDEQAVPRYLVHQNAGLTYLKGDHKGAERLSELAEAQPWSDALDERCWAASALIASDQFNAALPLLKAITEHAPDHAGAWFLLAWCHYNQEPSLDARVCCDKYLTLQPDGAWGYYNRGLLSLKEGNWASAESDFTKVLKKYPDMALAYAHRASARRRLQKNLAAIDDLSLAIQFAPGNPEYYYLRHQIHARLGNHELAESDRQNFLRHEPLHGTGWYYRGLAKYATDPRGALADFEKALALDPGRPQILYKKACLLADAFGRPREAVATLSKVIELEPEHVDARFKRGLLLARLGNRSGAVADAERMIQYEKTPMRHYQAASIYAWTAQKIDGDAKRAIDLLSYALRHDYGVDDYQKDANLQPLARYARFRLLAEALEILGPGNPPRMRP